MMISICKKYEGPSIAAEQQFGLQNEEYSTETAEGGREQLPELMR